MTTWEDVVRLASGLPEVEAATWYRTPALKVAGKGFARLRTEAEGGLVVMCGLDEKVDVDQLRELLEEAWRLKAPKRLTT